MTQQGPAKQSTEPYDTNVKRDVMPGSPGPAVADEDPDRTSKETDKEVTEENSSNSSMPQSALQDSQQTADAAASSKDLQSDLHSNDPAFFCQLRYRS